MYNIGIIGYGVVGRAIDYTFQKKTKLLSTTNTTHIINFQT